MVIILLILPFYQKIQGYNCRIYVATVDGVTVNCIEDFRNEIYTVDPRIIEEYLLSKNININSI